jgi:hypothetical protein
MSFGKLATIVVLASTAAFAAPREATAGPRSTEMAGKQVYQQALEFYRAQIESGNAAFYGVEKDYELNIYVLTKFEDLLCSDFRLLVDYLTVETVSTVENIGGPITGTQAFATQGPLNSVYTKYEAKNPFGFVIGTYGLCAKPFVNKQDCQVGFGDNDDVAPVVDVPLVTGCVVSGKQCGWIDCPGIPGWQNGWQYRCCQLTVTCTQSFILFDRTVQYTDTLYAAKCG